MPYISYLFAHKNMANTTSLYTGTAWFYGCQLMAASMVSGIWFSLYILHLYPQEK